MILVRPADPRPVVERIRAQGWMIVPGFDPRDEVRLQGMRIARRSPVRTIDDASQAVLAAVRGVGVMCEVDAPPEVLASLYDDLRQFGPVDVIGVVDEKATEPVALDGEELALLRSLAEGLTLGDAAARSAMSRRTADRRLASARRRLGASSTAEALVTARRLGLIGGSDR